MISGIGGDAYVCDSLEAVRISNGVSGNRPKITGVYDTKVREHHTEAVYVLYRDAPCRKYGTDGYVLLFDFSKFFDRVSHRLVKGILRKEFSDERLLKITEHFIDAFGAAGMGLGSQISQVLALASANRLDHYIKEVCRIRGYGRYMDDGYLLHPSKDYLKKCLEGIKAICAELEITLNEKKTQIVKLSHGFTYLKVRFFLLPSGRIVRKIYHRSVTKMRQKLKAFSRLLDAGVMTFADVYASWQSWKAYALNFNAYHTIQNMGKLFDKLFIQNWRCDYALLQGNA